MLRYRRQFRPRLSPFGNIKTTAATKALNGAPETLTIQPGLRDRRSSVYGDPAATTVSYGPSSGQQIYHDLLSPSLSLSPTPAAFHGLTMKLLVDDGCVVYLNGNEVARRNMPDGDVNYKTPASVTVAGADETTFFKLQFSPSSDLVAGDNVIAVRSSPSRPTQFGYRFRPRARRIVPHRHRHHRYRCLHRTGYGHLDGSRSC